ncbi:ATP-binding protein [Paraburkholderia caribensis]|uniref:ATP-binding protein n=1 Tax=Paraburkholderia caribensis TaxID=75105 RepID=A0A9Q6S7N1_9BURK|nr:ATP-binding protein [Paraburkholderia caribensis]MCO4880122.1 ATP-binding protein [Paraburkholderia caribensis]PTB26256.1 ATPase [Paraburkholderia caribensis]QLB66125.1 ATPase [Paraburkholderia caribensis]
MNRRLSTSPFDPSRYVGSVSYVSPDAAKINLPFAASVSARQYSGYAVLGGQVGEFVFIEGEGLAVLGRITEVRLPDNERLKAEPVLGERPDAHPIGFVQLLTTLELATGKVISGIPVHPRIGQQVYSAHPLLVKHIVEGNNAGVAGLIELATISQESGTRVNVSPAHMFGRHCAVLGATGGGKSWTVARIVQEAARIGGKIILIDPTGEFHTFTEGVQAIHLGGERESKDDPRQFVAFPYWQLTEPDLFAIFQPSPGAQVPKLREALRSLKLNYVLHGKNEPHTVKKAGAVRRDFNVLWAQHESAVEAEGARYLISQLGRQIFEECVSENGGSFREPDYTVWGGYDERTKGYCETLVAKIYSITRSKSLRCLFHPEAFESSLTGQIDAFLESGDRVLRISMEFLPFDHNARELLANAIGRYLLGMARQRAFEKMPVVVMLDEAHQFLNRNMGDENNRIHLDAFGLIAKEGRKYGLTTILATQRPRDVPEDVLSQMGMFIVHRLINERDRDVVEKACGNLDGSAAAFLPTLGQGEAILVGVDFPMPTPVKITEPEHPPKSEGPAYHRFWKA